VSNCAQAEQVEVSRERSGRRGASGLSACTRVPSEAAQSGYSPQVYGGLALARLAVKVRSETVASFTARGDCFVLGDLCPSAPVELTSIIPLLRSPVAYYLGSHLANPPQRLSWLSREQQRKASCWRPIRLEFLSSIQNMETT
jgi:hypothetical protein